MMVLWGHMSPQLLQKIMALLVQDLKSHAAGTLDTDHIDKLAGLGANGTYPNHIWGQFKRLLPQPKLPNLHYIWLPMKHNVLGRFFKHVPMLLPHELFGAIYEHYPVMWRKIVFCSERTCQRFWNAVRPSPQFSQHPVRFRDNFETKCIPLKLHGDGTPVTGLGKSWSKMVDVFSVSSLLISGPTILRNLLIFMLFQHLQSVVGGHHTFNTVYRKLKWSFQVLWEGKKPHFDWKGDRLYYAGAGDDLMGGYFMCLWALICDLDHCYKCYEMPNSTSNIPCGLCPCDSSALGTPWFDFRPNAVWMTMVYTVQTWIAAGLKRSLIFDIVGVTILSFYPDWMHCKALGIDKNLLGSTLYLLVHFILPDDVDTNLHNIWEDIEVVYHQLETECRYGHMRQTMFTTKSAPKLKGKAAEIKDFGPVMVEIWKNITILAWASTGKF